VSVGSGAVAFGPRTCPARIEGVKHIAGRTSKTGSSFVKLQKFLRNAVAGTLIACLPVSATVAATRPNAAVPMASSQAVTGQYDNNGAAGVPWIPLIAIGIAAIVAIVIIAGHNGKGSGALSRG
jgi:hypothetical protein